MRYALIALALFLSATGEVYAIPKINKNLHVIRILGPNLASDALHATVANYATYKLEQVGVRVRRINLITRPTICAELANVFSSADLAREYNCYRRLASSYKLRGIIYFLLPARIQGGVSWMTGAANRCQLGNRQGVAIGHGIDFRFPTGEPRQGASRIIAAHELGHLAGAPHSDTGLMHPNAGAFALSDNNIDLPWADSSVASIGGCIRLVKRFRKLLNARK